MPIIDKTKYSYNDLTIEPAVISSIKSRKECDPYEHMDVNMRDYLPLFTAPMSTIANEHNFNIWKKNKIMPMLPRNIGADPNGSIEKRISYIKDFLDNGDWVALSLKEFEYVFVEHKMMSPGQIFPGYNRTYRVCVDLANGHMECLYDTINKAKEIARNNNYTLIVMTGNIANPETYRWICKHAEVDYIRLSVGSGANCITATQTSIHYPIASLIDECKHIKNRCEGKSYVKSTPYIIADGGVRGYADVIKAIALGADYVMIGSLFTGLLESAAPLDIECYNSHYKYGYAEGIINDGINNILNLWDGLEDEDDNDTLVPIDNKELEQKKKDFIKDMKDIVKESYGMSTKKAQKLINPNAKSKTSEGCTKYIHVKETVKQWSDNMIDYFRSAMSYTNKKYINDFRGKVDLIIISSSAILAVNK